MVQIDVLHGMSGGKWPTSPHPLQPRFSRFDSIHFQQNFDVKQFGTWWLCSEMKANDNPLPARTHTNTATHSFIKAKDSLCDNAVTRLTLYCSQSAICMERGRAGAQSKWHTHEACVAMPWRTWTKKALTRSSHKYGISNVEYAATHSYHCAHHSVSFYDCSATCH